MKICDFFDRTYIINLPDRPDRRRAVVQELQFIGESLTPGRVELFPGIRPDDRGNFPSLGARGCFLSHLGVLKQARADRLNHVLVMEDDLLLSKYFKKHEAGLVEQLQATDWDLVYLGLHEKNPMVDEPVELTLWTQPLVKAHFYGVNGNTLDRLIVFLETLLQRPPGHAEGGPMHVDGAYNTFRQQNPDIIARIALPNLGCQRSSRSDIATNAWFDRLPIVTDVMTTARSVKTWINR
jgi:hypothetical protein